jgi:hypothetical protein
VPKKSLSPAHNAMLQKAYPTLALEVVNKSRAFQPRSTALA